MVENETTKPATNAVSSNRLFEYFCDESYYHLWCVRPANERRWGHCYHVQSKEEARGLAEELSQLEQIKNLVTVEHETKESFIARVRACISNKVITGNGN